tara:strand:- start:3063 stop:3464 length:402 start_codon:yes stop_codon:yes gene_type:complete
MSKEKEFYTYTVKLPGRDETVTTSSSPRGAVSRVIARDVYKDLSDDHQHLYIGRKMNELDQRFGDAGILANKMEDYGKDRELLEYRKTSNIEEKIYDSSQTEFGFINKRKETYKSQMVFEFTPKEYIDKQKNK